MKTKNFEGKKHARRVRAAVRAGATLVGYQTPPDTRIRLGRAARDAEPRTAAVPPMGTRYAFTYGRTARRVYELYTRLSEGAARRAGQHGCDRNVLRLVEETGFPAGQAAGVGAEIFVEDRWFLTHRSGLCSPHDPKVGVRPHG